MDDKADFDTMQGNGGEAHQQVHHKGGKEGTASEGAHLTTNQGIRISDNQNSLKSGARGPILLEDFVLREKIFHFDHERIPERIVHARGSGAHGYFELTESLADITRADLFQRVGEKTPLFARFSTVAGGAGSVDTPRDVRGFAVKFYTKEGNWDLVGNNIPVFFIQDAIKFPDLIHAVKMEADKAYPQAASAHDTFWDFVSLMPESTHMLMWAMSDRAIPRSLRMIEGFGIHTFVMVNAKGKESFVKFHWRPKLGMQSTVWDEEQAAFCPANIVPGIDFSNDPLLQGRLFSYLDTQKSRLGTANFHQIPVNAPKCPMHNFQRDGMMQTQVPKGRANYEPNSLADYGEINGPRECPATGFTSFAGRAACDEQGDKLRIRAELFADHYSQARLFWKSQTDNERAHVASAFTFELSKVGLAPVQARMVANLRNVDEDLAKRVAAGLAIDLPKASPAARKPIDMEPSPALSIQKKMLETLKGRQVGILIADGSDAAELTALIQAIEAEGGKAVVVAPKVGGVKLADGSMVKADGQLAGSPSQIFDAVAVLVSDAGAQALLKEAAAVEFVMNAFGHLKAIGHTPEARPLLDKAGVVADDGIVSIEGLPRAGARRYFDREPAVRMLA